MKAKVKDTIKEYNDKLDKLESLQMIANYYYPSFTMAFRLIYLQRYYNVVITKN